MWICAYKKTLIYNIPIHLEHAISWQHKLIQPWMHCDITDLSTDITYGLKKADICSFLYFENGNWFIAINYDAGQLMNCVLTVDVRSWNHFD